MSYYLNVGFTFTLRTPTAVENSSYKLINKRQFQGYVILYTNKVCSVSVNNLKLFNYFLRRAGKIFLKRLSDLWLSQNCNTIWFRIK